MGKQYWIALCGVLVLASSAGAFDRTATSVEAADSLEVVAPGWIVRSGDNICGLNDAKKLSNPGKVRYSELRAATPEMKKIKDKNIDPNSPEGIQLKQAAADRVRKAAAAIQSERGHCSVWKKIRHRDGRTITDLTALIKKRL